MSRGEVLELGVVVCHDSRVVEVEDRVLTELLEELILHYSCLDRIIDFLMSLDSHEIGTGQKLPHFVDGWSQIFRQFIEFRYVFGNLSELLLRLDRVSHLVFVVQNERLPSLVA